MYPVCESELHERKGAVGRAGHRSGDLADAAGGGLHGDGVRGRCGGEGGLGARRVGQVAAPMPGAPDRALPLMEL